MKKQENNYAFIDGQNLHLWTNSEKWNIDFERFRVYLKDKYKVSKVYYFLGYVKEENNWLYTKLQENWYIVIFKKQMYEMKSIKKWNIDSDMIFRIMKKLIEEPNKFDKIVIVTWDWDFRILVDYFIEKNRFKKILFPNKKYTSCLYKSLNIIYKDYLLNIKQKIEYKKKKLP